MAEFLGDIAGMLEIFAIAGGLVLLARARKEAPARLLAAAGWVLVVGGISVGLCTSYYWFRYQSRGDFAAAHGPSAGMTGRVTGPGMMGPVPGSMPGSGSMHGAP